MKKGINHGRTCSTIVEQSIKDRLKYCVKMLHLHDFMSEKAHLAILRKIEKQHKVEGEK